MSARDELAAAVAEHGPFPVPVGTADEADRLRAELAGLRQGYAALESRCDYIAKAAVSWRKEADGRKAYGLTLRARAAELKAAAIAALAPHTKFPDSPHCSADGDPWPCHTVYVLAPVAWPDGPAPRDLRPGAEAARRTIRDRQTTDVHPPHPAPCRVPSSPDCTCPVTP